MPESKRKRKSREREEVAETEAEGEPRAATGPAEAEPGASEAAPAAEPEDPVAALQAEVASLRDQLLRALAETENVRRRARREREEAVRYAAAPLVRDLVEVADTLRRALDAVPAEAVEADEHLKTLMTGVEMTEKALQGVFEKHDIVKIDPLGERLDPHYHEAIFEVPNPDAPAGTVMQVMRVGYRLGDRLLRPAQVGVATGGPSPAPRTAPEGAGGDAEGEGGEAKGDASRGEDGAASAPGSHVDTTA